MGGHWHCGTFGIPRLALAWALQCIWHRVMMVLGWVGPMGLCSRRGFWITDPILPISLIIQSSCATHTEQAAVQQQQQAIMCPGPQASSSQKHQGLQLGGAAAAAAAADAATTVPAGAREGNGKEEGVWDFFRSYTDEPHRSRCVRVCVCVLVGCVMVFWVGRGRRRGGVRVWVVWALAQVTWLVGSIDQIGHQQRTPRYPPRCLGPTNPPHQHPTIIIDDDNQQLRLPQAGGDPEGTPGDPQAIWALPLDEVQGRRRHPHAGACGGWVGGWVGKHVLPSLGATFLHVKSMQSGG
jgi:hypothetical protein